MGAIYRREMGAFFTSGVAYVFLTVFFLLSGIFFYNGVILSGTTETSNMFGSMFIIVLFLIPILTMKLMSEEKKNRTDQGLLTAPVGLWSIVLGKYFSALTLFIIAESIVFVYSIILGYLGNIVWTTLLGNYFAMLFLGAGFIAIGISYHHLRKIRWHQPLQVCLCFSCFIFLIHLQRTYPMKH